MTDDNDSLGIDDDGLLPSEFFQGFRYGVDGGLWNLAGVLFVREDFVKRARNYFQTAILLTIRNRVAQGVSQF